MSNDPKSTQHAQPTPDDAETEIGAQAGAANATEPSGDGAPKHHDDVIGELRREVADLKDRILRAAAEVENVRKRAEREKDETAKYAVTRFARDVLNIGDNFQRALSAVPPGAAEADAALKALIDGVMLSEREYLNVLERHGVKRIEAQDQPFNPHLHQAVMEMPRPDVVAGTVVQVFQAGFMIGDRTLRPSMVVVASGGPKSKPTEQAAATGETGEPPTAGNDGEPPLG